MVLVKFRVPEMRHKSRGGHCFSFAPQGEVGVASEASRISTLESTGHTDNSV